MEHKENNSSLEQAMQQNTQEEPISSKETGFILISKEEEAQEKDLLPSSILPNQHTQEAQQPHSDEFPHRENEPIMNDFLPHHQKMEKKQASKQANRFKTPLLMAGCLMLGGVGGFGGFLLADQMLGNNRTAVIYQSVTRSDQEGNEITNMSIKDVVANTEQSVVEITTESAANDSYFQQMITTGAGSGVIISKDGYIVTNNHVIDGANKITVRTKDGNEYDATLIGKDSISDLAVIKINALNLTPALLGTSSDLSVGDEAIAIGNPLGELGGTVTRGIISALDREITIDGQSMTLLQTDTAINKGNSGGGLFNTNGELIGIVNAKSSGTSVEGLGFAIPIDTAKPIIESLISSGYVTGRPQLGVSMVNISDEMSAFQAGVDQLGVYIAKIGNDSAAQEAGFEVRDRIISVDGKEISSSSDVAKIIAEKSVGDSITVVVERDRKQITLKATLKEAGQQ